MFSCDIPSQITPSLQPAIEHLGQTLNYAQFCHAANQIASQIQPHRSGRVAPIAIVMDRGFEFYSSQFAALSTGGFFLPIDPANPDERIQFLLTDSEADCVLVDSQSWQRIKQIELSNCQVIKVEQDFLTARIPNQVSPLVIPHADQDWAYMIYTSGSTGKPKGVCIHWDAICNHNAWFIDQYQVTQRDRCSQIASIGFDISIEEIFTTLRAHACLVSIEKRALESPSDFLNWVDEKKLTLLNVPTALWHNIVPSLASTQLPDSVRVVLIGGEQVNPQWVQAWFQHVPADQVRLVNAYGPTETTITATVCDLTPEIMDSIGKPIANLECHIIDANNRPVLSSNTPGELLISGVGVAQGYWNRPEKTAQSFFHCDALQGKWCYRTGDKVQMDDHGRLSFLGRIDNQVKLRGYRIELDEIENTVCSHPQIQDAIVRKVTSPREQLVCFAKSTSNSPTDAVLQQDVVNFLKHKLPAYMVPSRFIFVESFPVTVGGKIDVKQLTKLATDNEPSAAPELVDANATQTAIAEAWHSVLGSMPATFDTPFEQAGGDSLAAMALALRLEKSFPHKKFGVATLLSYQTINQLSSYVDQSSSQQDQFGDADELAPLINSIGQPLAPQTPCLIFFHPGGGSGYLYHQLIDSSIGNTHSVLILDSPWLTGKLPTQDHQETTLSIARRYADTLTRRLHRQSEITTVGFSFGGILAFESARCLSEDGYSIKQVINIDQPIPESIRQGNLVNRVVNWLHRLKTPRLTWYELHYSNEKEALQADQPNSFSNPQEMRRSFDLEDIHAHIEDAYEPKFCDLDMHLIRGDVIEAKFSVANDYGWEKYTRRLTVDRVSGTHFTIFLGRNVKKLAKKFQRLFQPTRPS